MAKKETEKRDDTPLATSPQPITDLEGVFADIDKRSKERRTAKAESQKKISAAREERNKNRSSSGGSGLFGLASFKSTTGNNNN
jgi:hypothetical protein